MSDEKTVVHQDHLDFTDHHMRLGLNVKGKQWTGLTVKECEELAVALSGPRSETLIQVRTFFAQAALWGAKHPEALEGHGEVSA